MENEDEEIIDDSMLEKMNKMYSLAWHIEDYYYAQKIDVCNVMTDPETDMLYAIIDNLTGKYIIDRMTGHCSLQTMLDNPPEKLEKIIDDKIIELLKIKEKYTIIF